MGRMNIIESFIFLVYYIMELLMKTRLWNFKKEELHCQQAFEIINQNQRIIEKIQKEESEIKREIQSFSQTKEKINDDISLIGNCWALF